MPDHEVLFGQLRVRLQEQITPHVLLLRSKDCNSGSYCTLVSLSSQSDSSLWYVT